MVACSNCHSFVFRGVTDCFTVQKNIKECFSKEAAVPEVFQRSLNSALNRHFVFFGSAGGKFPKNLL